MTGEGENQLDCFAIARNDNSISSPYQGRSGGVSSRKGNYKYMFATHPYPPLIGREQNISY